MNPPIQAVIFDFDGTLADTFPAIHAAWNAAMVPIFGRQFSRDEVVARFGPSDEGMMERELANHSPEEMHHAFARYYAAYEGAHDAVFGFDGIGELLEELQNRAFPTAVMTGKGRRAAEISLRHLGWAGRFSVLVTGTEILNAKPSPDGPLCAAELLGIAPQHCIYVGDSPADIGAAQSAGMRSVVAGWHSYFLPQLRDMKPDFWANEPRDVLSILDGA